MKEERETSSKKHVATVGIGWTLINPKKYKRNIFKINIKRAIKRAIKYQKFLNAWNGKGIDLSDPFQKAARYHFCIKPILDGIKLAQKSYEQEHRKQ